MAVDAEAVALVLLPIAFGVGVGFLLNPLSEAWSNRRRRKAFAAVLAPEVETIRVMAQTSVEDNESRVQQVKETFSKPEPSFSFVAVEDVDYPTRVYDSHLLDVDLFHEKLALQVTELYRWVAYADHWKGRHLDYYQEFMAITRTMMTVGGAMTKNLASYLSATQRGMIHYADVYLEVERRITKIADAVGEELSAVGGRARPEVNLILERELHSSSP